MSKPRVVQIGKYFPPVTGGIESHLYDLCRGIRDEVDLTVVVAGDSGGTVRENTEGYDVIRLSAPVTLFSTPICPSLPGLLKRIEADLFHLHVPNPLAMFFLSKHIRNRKLVVTWHSDIVRQKNLRLVFHGSTRAMLEKAHGIIVPTQMHIDTSEYLPEFKEKVTIIPYGIQTGNFDESMIRFDLVESIRKRYPGQRVLFVGRLVPYKGLDILLQSIRSIHCSLIIVGEGPLKQKLQTMAHDLDLSSRVWFTGRIPDDDLPSYYHACDIFCLPSVGRNEGFGIVQLEAMAAGKPVISSNLPTGVRTVAVDGKTGLLVEPGNVRELENALKTLLNNPALIRTMGDEGLKRVQSEYDLTSSARKTLHLYREILV